MKKFIYVALIVLSYTGSYAQQDPILTNYLSNSIAINPAYAGTSEALSINLVERVQWVGMSGGPNTTSFTTSTNLPNPHLGIGLFAYRDALGPTVETGMMGSFAYRILFPKGKLSFGVQFGFDYLGVDWNKLNPEDPSDPLINNQVKDKAALDAGFGMYYSSNLFFVGVASTHLLENKILVSEDPTDGKTSFSKLLRHFYLNGGFAIPLSDNLLLRPTAMLRYVANSPLQADLDVGLLIHEVLWVGLGYRTENCLNFMVEVNIAKNLHIGYSYDAWFNPLMSNNMGSHEIRIGYDLDLFKTGRMVSPRVF